MWGDDNDEEFLRALEVSRREYEEKELPRLSQLASAPSPINIRDESLPGPSTSTSEDPFKRPFPCTTKGITNAEECELYDGPEAEGFNFKTGHAWVYPTSDKYPVRTYQRDIVEKALFTNTLVSLPTGLGKTFIAAVVMYNFYMWYPNGKIIFMAPTKPLVAQQIENCINIVGIPESHTAEMTGALNSKMRAVMWKEKRVFFLTPQCVQNDLSSNVCPANAVKCVVIDEAHRALGDHAYAQVIRILNSYEARFRVLALSATPGSDLEAVQKVVSNLMISHIELRGEDSLDIVQYTHERNLELMVVDVGPTINRIRVKFVAVAMEYAKYLLERKLLFGNISSLARFTVLKEWENFRREGSKGMDPAVCNRVNTHFAIVHTFVHGLELLQTYGLRLLLNHMKSALNKGDASANRLSVNEDLTALMEEIELVLNPIDIDEGDNDDSKSKKRFIYGHPKLDRLQEIVVSHFENFEKKGEATRTIVFCEYREGVIEICDMLEHFKPLVKPVVFMGQSAGKTSKGIPQKQQLKIMEKFKKGIYNTLISTSVGEEGLDIGEVDLIICFDAKNSPIRQVQRMGRTGRKRQGKIIMLVTRGKEEQKYNQGLFKKKSVSSVLLNKENLASHLLEESPRLLPPGVQPVYTEMKVVQATLKPKSNQQDLRKMFLKHSKGGSSALLKPATSSKISFGKSPFLSEDEFEELKLTWNNAQECCKFDRIPKRTEFWFKSAGDVETKDLEQENVDLATYLEFMRYQQRTHVIGNSSDSQLLSSLLMWADNRRDSEQSTLCGGLSSQVTSTQIWPAKSKKRGRQPALESKPMDPPKKRGCPRKNGMCNSPAKPKENNFLNTFFLPTKPKSKAQFIEDDEYSPPDVPNSSPEPKPSTSAFLPPPSKPMQTNFKPRVNDDVILIDSDDEDDLNSSLSSGFGYMSSQTSRQDLYSELSRALKNQALGATEDECSICDSLFLCESLNKLVLDRKSNNTGTTWSNVRKSLEDALILVPKLTIEGFAKYYKSADESEKIVSLLPKFEIAADDEMCDGMLCGGLGDLSPPRSISPQNNYLSPSQLRLVHSPKQNDEDCIKLEFVDSPTDMKHSRREISNPVNVKVSIDEATPSCSTPRKDSPTKAESSVHYEFENASFDFLGLSNIDDMFGSQTETVKESINTSRKTLQSPDVLKSSSTKAAKSSVKSEGKLYDLHESANLIPGKCSPDRSMNDFFKREEEFSSASLTPTKVIPAAEEQVSPILCSQAAKKTRRAFRFKKRTILDESVKPEVYEIESKDSSEDEVHNEYKFKQTIPEGEVTSSSNLNSWRSVSPPEVNFDICDTSFFQLSDEDNGKKSEVDEALKETVRKKAEEARAKVKQSDLTFTQEVNQMCETTLGGLTQIMDMFEAKEKSPELKVERADSSTSLQAQRRSPSPNASSAEGLNVAMCDNNEVLFGSEEDLFADCDDSEFLYPNCVVSMSKPPATPGNYDGDPVPSTLSKDNFHSSFVKVSGSVGDLGNGEDRQKQEDMVPKADKCLSPVFESSQMVRKPSKLSLKKKNLEINCTQANKKTAATINDEGVSDKSHLKITPPAEEQVKDTKQSDVNSQVDFSMFGDEFNNSWLYSQNDEVVNTEGMESSLKSRGLKSEAKALEKISTSFPEEVHAVESQLSRASRDSSPENELDVAFAKLDASLREKKKSGEGAMLSSPKTYRESKWFLKEKSNAALGMKSWLERDHNASDKWIGRNCSSDKGFKHGRLNMGRLALTGTSVANGHIPSSVSNHSQTGWLSTAIVTRNETRPESIQKNLNLSDFCDDSLLETLENDVSEILVTKELPLKKKLSLGKKTSDTSPICEETRTSLALKATDAGKEEEVIFLSSDDEIQSLNQRKRKKCLNLTSSSEEGFMQGKSVGVSKLVHVENCAVTKKRNRDALQSSSTSEDSVHNNHPSRKTKMPKREETSIATSHKNVLNLSSFCDDTLLDNLTDDENDDVHKAAWSVSSDDDFVSKDKSTKTKKRPRKRKKSKKGNGFILSEAEESDGMCNSSDGESTSLDELDSSFINDSQPEASQSVDIQAKYLQSLRSPAVGAGKFKIPSRMPQMDIDVYSQYPDADELEQTYADDSFCVDDEPTQYEHEMSLLEIAEARLEAKRRGKLKLKKHLKSGNPQAKGGRFSDSDDSDDKNKVKKKRLKRIRLLDETTYENEDAGREHQGPAPAVNVTKKSPASRVISDASESTNKKNVKETDNDNLALLLDDDLDFSAIPDISDIPDIPVSVSVVTRKDEAPTSISAFKFVKKTPMLLSEGSSIKVNPQSLWTRGVNSSNLQWNLQPTAKQASIPRAGPSLPKISDRAPALQQRPGACATSSDSKVSSSAASSQTLIVASSRQVAASPDLIRVLRVNYLVTIIPHSVPDADFILSWRLGVSRIFASDLRDKKKLEELAKKLKSSYSRPHLIVECDRIKSLAMVGFQKKGKKAKVTAPVDKITNTQFPWTSAICCGNAAFLRQAGILLLFSQNFDDSARFLAKLAKKETNHGHGIPEVALDLPDHVETRLLFFCSLPCVNYAFALKLLAKFATLSEFFARCSSVCDISTNLQVDLQAAKQIHRVLCENHFSP